MDERRVAGGDGRVSDRQRRVDGPCAQLERDLETMTRMYEAELRGRRTEAATVHSRPTSATDSAPVAAPASLHSPSVTVFTARRHDSAVYAVVLCLSVCLSITSRCSTETAKRKALV